MPAARKILPDIIHVQVQLQKIAKNIKKYKRNLNTFNEAELKTLQKLIKVSKGEYNRLRKGLQNYESEAMRGTQIRKHFTRAEDETLNRILKDMPKINQDLYDLKMRIDRRIKSLQDTIIEIDPMTRSELQSLTPIVPSSSTIVDSPTPLIDSLTPRPMSQLTTIVESETPPISVSQLSTIVEKEPEDINEEIKRRVVEGINEFMAKELKKIRRRKGRPRADFEAFLKQFEDVRRDNSPSPSPPPSLPQRRRESIEIDVSQFLKKRTSSPPTSPMPKPKPKPKSKEQLPQIGAPIHITKSMIPAGEPYVNYLTPSYSESPSIVELGGSRDLFQMLNIHTQMVNLAIASGQLNFSMGGNQYNFNANPSLLQREVTTFKEPPKALPQPSSQPSSQPPPPPPPDTKMTITELEKPTTPTPKPIITPSKEDPSKAIITTVIPEPNSPKPAAVLVSKVKITKQDRKRLREERKERERLEKEKQEKRILREKAKEQKLQELRKAKEQKLQEEKEQRERAANREKERVEREEETTRQIRAAMEMRQSQRVEEINQFLPEVPPIPDYNIGGKTLLSTKILDIMDPQFRPGSAPQAARFTNGNLMGSLGVAPGLNRNDLNMPPTQVSGQGPNGGGTLRPNSNMSIRMQGQGHFMEGVNKFINHNLSKSDLFGPEPTKRNAENIDPLAQEAQIVPYWDTTGLEDIGTLPPSMTTSNGAFNKPVTTNPQKFVFMTYQSGINTFYNCKLPMKVNIPSGDFGIYKVTVNEVLFRTDMNLLDADDYIDFTFNDPLLIMDDSTTPETLIAKIKLPSVRISINSWTKYIENLHINYLNVDMLVEILNQMIQSNTEILYRDSIAGVKVYLKNILQVSKQKLAGVGLYFSLQDFSIDGNTYIKSSETSFNISNCSTNFRHILPPLQTTTVMTSTKNTFFNFDQDAKKIIKQCESIYIPRCNFAGPQLILFNSSAQTTCPISNEYAKQFNTCALSYNTNEDTNSLIQMTSNVELTMKNTNEFRVWLTDNYGEPIKIQSPIYVQVTVQPFVNETSTAMNE